ncbi:MAG: ribonuclease III [Gammaproteobacteria bacterium]
MSEPLAALEHALNYRFRDPALLERALSHSSSGALDNERLEFLGDAVLEAAISADLFFRHPDLDEGTLSRWRAVLVNGEALAAIGAGLALGGYLRLGTGEAKTGGRERHSNLADALEAVIGAVFVDGGFEDARRVIHGIFVPRLNAEHAPAALLDGKSRLQEVLQAQALALPAYTVTQVTGLDHAQTFRVRCEIAAAGICTEGTGTTRRAAEQMAAARALERLRHA